MTQETEKPNAPDEAAQGKRKTARELHQKIARNPKWRDTTMATRRSFVIGGAKPPKDVSGD
jgi:hypothetical protein